MSPAQAVPDRREATASIAANAKLPPTEIRLTPSRASSATGRRTRPHQDVDRQIDGRDDRADDLRARGTRRVQHVGAGLLIGLQAGDRVVKILATVQEVLGPGRQHQARRAGVGDLRGGADALGGLRQR